MIWTIWYHYVSIKIKPIDFVPKNSMVGRFWFEQLGLAQMKMLFSQSEAA